MYEDIISNIEHDFSDIDKRMKKLIIDSKNITHSYRRMQKIIDHLEYVQFCSESIISWCELLKENIK